MAQPTVAGKRWWRGFFISSSFWQDWSGLRETEFGSRLWWNWDVDSEHYPEWVSMLAELRAKGVRVMTYTNPFLADSLSANSTRRNLYAEAKRRGLLVNRQGGGAYRQISVSPEFSFGTVDLTNPSAFDFIVKVGRPGKEGRAAVL